MDQHPGDLREEANKHEEKMDTDDAGSQDQVNNMNADMENKSKQTTSETTELSQIEAQMSNLCSSVVAQQIAHNESRFTSHFSVISVLGNGTIGAVFKVKNRLDLCDYAVKRISFPSKYIEKIMMKLPTLIQIDHTSITRVHCFWVEHPPLDWQIAADRRMLDELQLPNDSLICSKGYSGDIAFVYIQTKQCDFSLHDWLRVNMSTASRKLPRMLLWFKQMVSALDYLHDMCIFHRNLKPKNILFSEEDRIMLSDMEIGFMDIIDDKEANKDYPLLNGTIEVSAYRSPETKMYRTPNNSKSDIFSLGLILAEMCVVMTEEEARQIFEDYRYGRTNKSLDFLPEVKEFVAWLTNIKPQDRPDCGSILDHPILTNNLQSASPLTRCPFFPNCTRINCRDVHPVQPCSEFPNCPRGVDCLYIHHTCPDDGHCIREECAYEHYLTAPALLHRLDSANSGLSSSLRMVNRSLQRANVVISGETIPFLLPEGYQDRRIHYLGCGTFGIVIRTVITSSFAKLNRIQTDLEVAIKMLKQPMGNERTAQLCYRELLLLKYFDHPNIARLVDVYTSANCPNELSDIYLVMEYVGSTLDAHLRASINDRHTYIPMEVIPRIIHDTLRALQYLMHANILHRDLKPSHLTIKPSGRVVLIGFAVARTGIPGEGRFDQPLEKRVGTVAYNAPEVLFWEEDNYGPEADIWSLGCILAELITWEPLFSDARSKVAKYISLFQPISDEFLSKVTTAEGVKKYIEQKNRTLERGNLNEYLMKMNKVANFHEPKDVAAIDLLWRCVQYDPELRISINDALRHPFLAEFYKPDEYTDLSNVRPLVYNDTRSNIQEWREALFEEIGNFHAREDTPMPSRH